MEEEKIRLSIGPRISEFVVLFTLAAEIANEVLGVSLDVERIRDFCYLHIIVVNAEEANLGERAYEYLLRYVSENPEDFPEDLRCESLIRAYYSNTKIKGCRRGHGSLERLMARNIDSRLCFLKMLMRKFYKRGDFHLLW